MKNEWQLGRIETVEGDVVCALFDEPGKPTQRIKIPRLYFPKGVLLREGAPLEWMLLEAGRIRVRLLPNVIQINMRVRWWTYWRAYFAIWKGRTKSRKR